MPTCSCPSLPTPTPRVAVAAIATALVIACGVDTGTAPSHEPAPTDTDGDARDGGPDDGGTEDAGQRDTTTESDGSEDCAADACAGAAPPAQFVPIADPFGHSFAFDPLEDPIAIGPGGALVDHDGDGDVDVFLGGTAGGSEPCLYENQSTPGTIAFAPVDAVCDARWLRRVHTGTGLDTDADGSEELLVGGSRFLGWAPQGDADAAINLFDTLLDDTDTRRRCDVGALVPVDLDLDGDLEVYVGCGHALVTAGPPSNLVFDPGPGAPRFWTADESGPLADDGHTLAVGVVDLDADGWWDLALADDTLSGPGMRNLTEEPGGALVRTPFPDLGWTLHRYASDYSAWGSFMGIGVLEPAGSGYGATLYLTDRGPNRVVTWTTDGFADDRAELWSEIALGYGPGNDDLFAWAAVTADFDGDGERDLYVSQGDVWPDRIAHGVDIGHEDAVAWFRGGAPARVTARSELAPADPDPRRNVRSAVALDLDGDGVLELLTVPLDGAARVDRIDEAGQARVCTVRPNATVTASRALGFEYGNGARWWPAEIEGRSRLGGPPVLTVPADTTEIRFPSGHAAPVSCGAGALVEVVEPTWITVTAAAGTITIDGPVDLDVYMEHGGEIAVLGVGTHVVVGAWRLAVRRNGRWVPRVWIGGE